MTWDELKARHNSRAVMRYALIGNSVGTGGNASPTSAGWAQRFAAEYIVRLNPASTMENHSDSGQQMSGQLSRYLTTVLGNQPHAVFLACMINDYCFGGQSKTIWKNTTRPAVNSIIAAGACPILVRENPLFDIYYPGWPLFLDACNELAAEYADGVVKVIDFQTPMEADKLMYLADPLHPNAIGHAAMLDIVVAALEAVPATDYADTIPYLYTGSGMIAGGYGDVAATVPLQTPVITWATPAPVIYGSALSATQLNATADVAGMFVYTPPAGSYLPVGAHTLSVLFTPTDTATYTTATATAELIVTPAASSEIDDMTAQQIIDSVVLQLTEVLLTYLPGSGSGNTAVNHNTGGTDNLRFTTDSGIGIDGATVTAYLSSDWQSGNTGTAAARGNTTTGPDGRWLTPLMLDSGLTYVITFYKQNDYNLSTTTITI